MELVYLQVGSSGALFGLLAVLLVEVLQGWKWVKRPCVELVKIVVLVVLLLGKYTVLVCHSLILRPYLLPTAGLESRQICFSVCCILYVHTCSSLQKSCTPCQL